MQFRFLPSIFSPTRAFSRMAACPFGRGLPFSGEALQHLHRRWIVPFHYASGTR
jgi:hypothetical protein